jgi:protein-tyrosine phosphatase
MGIALSTDAGSQQPLNAVILLSYKTAQLTPVSMLDFLQNPSASVNEKLILVEPKGAMNPPESDQTLIPTNMNFTQTLDLIRSAFRFRLVQIRGYRLWISVPIESQRVSFVQSIKNIPFTTFCSSEIIRLTDIFPTAGSIGSVGDAFRQAPKTVFNGTLNIDPVRPAIDAALICNSCDMIVPNIYVGGEDVLHDSNLLSSLGVTHVASLGSLPLSNDAASRQHYHIQLQDCPFAQLSQEFWNAVEFISEALKQSGVVLIRCRRGISRSPALCIAYLIEKAGYTFQRALELVTSKRPIVSLNPGFAIQLKQREKQVCIPMGGKNAPGRGETASL